MQADHEHSADSTSLDAAVRALRAGAQLYEVIGAPLYSTLCALGANDPEIAALVSRGRAGAAPMHLFSSVHYLLLRNPEDALSRYFGTLTAQPAPPATAFPEFVRFCREHRDEILRLLETRTVQTTSADRCQTVLPMLSRVADEAGEPLNLVEIGCSAGVLLTFDHYAYEVQGHGRLGPADAPLTLKLAVTGGPPLHVPSIGTRVGLDLHVIDVHSEDERRWLLALSFPEQREQQRALATALNVVAQARIRMIEGDALHTLRAVLAETPDPLCVFHSACLMYWTAQQKAALEELLIKASANRSLYRVSIEPTERFTAEQKGQTGNAEQAGARGPIRGEAIITRYRRGAAARVAIARTGSNFGSVEWLESGYGPYPQHNP